MCYVYVYSFSHWSWRVQNVPECLHVSTILHIVSARLLPFTVLLPSLFIKLDSPITGGCACVSNHSASLQTRKQTNPNWLDQNFTGSTFTQIICSAKLEILPWGSFEKTRLPRSVSKSTWTSTKPQNLLPCKAWRPRDPLNTGAWCFGSLPNLPGAGLVNFVALRVGLWKRNGRMDIVLYHEPSRRSLEPDPSSCCNTW